MQQEVIKGFRKMKAFEQSTSEMAGQIVGSDGVVEGGIKQPLDTLRDALKLAEDGSSISAKSNDDFRKIMEEAEAGVFQSKKVFQPPAVSTKTLGTWEKHTKGIGMKLLNKFGFTGRLGAREDGVSRAIEVVVRPNGQGLGFGDFTESSALVVNKKLVAEWSGVEYKEEEIAATAKKAKKIVTEQIADSKSWKKNKKEKQSVKTVSVSDFLDRKAGDEDPKLVIIDMRGEQTRVLTDYSEINTIPMEDETSGPKLGQELLYNMNLVVDLLEIDVNKHSRKLVQEAHKNQIVIGDLDLLEMQIERDAPRLRRLENIMKIIKKVSEKQIKESSRAERRGFNQSEGEQDEMEIDDSESSESDITLSAISSLFRTLHKNFKEEFHIFGLINLLPTLISPVLNKLFDSWSPLDEPDRLAEIHTAGAALGDYFEDSGEHSLRTQTRAIVDEAAQKVTMPSIHRVLANDWDVHNPDRCIALIEAIGVVYPPSVAEGLIDLMVQPKIAAAVKAWAPTKDPLPIHVWMHPWLPLMRSKLAPYYPEIRRKLAQALSSWQPEDLSALSVIRPWREIFDRDSMDKFLTRVIVPKLVVTLRGLQINPQNQDITAFNSVMAWRGVVADVHIISLFRGEFFSKWLRVLLSWLAISPDFGEVSEWYSGWRSCFPVELLEDADMVEPFNAALNYMNIALTVEESECATVLGREIASVVDTSYCAFYEKKVSELKMKEQLKELNKDNRYASSSNGGVPYSYGLGAPTGRAGEISFKDVVEAYAADSGVTFMPRPGREHEGKQVWVFGKSTCYLDQDVVFASVGDGTWRPMALEDLLKIS